MPRSTPPVKTEPTLEQLLEFEQSSTEKHGFVDGQVFLMAGGTRRHNRITLAKGVTYYPDVMIYCEAEDDPRLVKMPCGWRGYLRRRRTLTEANCSSKTLPEPNLPPGDR